MEFKKEVQELLSKNYHSPDEAEIVREFCEGLKDTNNTMLETNYYSYHSYKRNSGLHNEDSFKIVSRIYRKLKQQ